MIINNGASNSSTGDEKDEVVDDEEFTPVSEEDILENEKVESNQPSQADSVNKLVGSFLKKKQEIASSLSVKKAEVEVNKTENEQVDELVQVALTKGIERAVELAKRNKSPYILDEFHDKLIEEIRRIRDGEE